MHIFSGLEKVGNSGNMHIEGNFDIFMEIFVFKIKKYIKNSRKYYYPGGKVCYPGGKI